MSVTTSAFSTTDLDQAGHLMSLAYPANKLALSASDTDGFRLAITRHDLGPVRADSYDSTLALGYHMELADVVILSRITAGTVDFDDRHERFRAGPGDLMATIVEREYRSVMTSAAVDAVSIDLALLSDVSGVDTDILKGRLRHHLVDPVKARGWSATATYTVDAMLGAAEQPYADLFVAGANRVLAAALLSTVLTSAPPPTTTLVQPSAVRRAVAFIESNPDLPLLASDIARAAQISTHTLKQAFRRHLGTTPTAYLRRVRLDQARADLLDATPDDGTTVAAIAGHWGYGDLARFSHHYRRAFGERPSTTLHR